jgi:uncharacterized protein YgbK (DUF1537 family)
VSLRLGAIADDFTGATDLANTVARAGMPVVLCLGVPSGPPPPDVTDEARAVVVALKTRTIPAAAAVEQSLLALDWLRAAGAQQVLLKYCSTFDSTPAGNIGPVAEALLAALGSDFTVACPAFPGTGRTVYRGHLFVGDVLLSESGMRSHPLTPMTDANLVRVLQAQCRGPIGLVAQPTVAAGEAAITARFEQLRAQDVRIAIVDALNDEDLRRLGAACAGMPLVTGGSGIALGLPANWGVEPSTAPQGRPPGGSPAAIVSGSVSEATRGQVADALARGLPGYAVDPLRAAAGADVVGEALTHLRPHLEAQRRAQHEAQREAQRDGRAASLPGAPPVLVHASADPQQVLRVQERLGAARAAEVVESALAAVAAQLVHVGVRRLVVAGGETAGAVAQALGVTQLWVGAQIDPGVPWCATTMPTGEPLHVALKSGNFGSADFFTKAFAG